MNRKLLSVLFLAFALSGCGGDEVVVQNVSQKSKGQELQDLQQAYDKGIITQKEYEKQKDIILDRK
jgi:PBP1b-binding outer membrane lipoprotein LpoB